MFPASGLSVSGSNMHAPACAAVEAPHSGVGCAVMYRIRSAFATPGPAGVVTQLNGADRSHVVTLFRCAGSRTASCGGDRTVGRGSEGNRTVEKGAG